MEKQPTSTHFIRFQDCDPMGHLNNASYINYFMNAREDHLLSFYGLDIYQKMRSEGKSWVVGKSEIIYKTPALLMDKVMIQTQVLQFSSRKIKVEMAMFDEHKKQLRAIMWSIFIPVDVRSQKTDEHSPELMALLEKVHYPLIAKTIDERMMEFQTVV